MFHEVVSESGRSDDDESETEAIDAASVRAAFEALLIDAVEETGRDHKR